MSRNDAIKVNAREEAMPARSFIGDMEEAARRFYATAIRGEVSDANVQGYLRAASQIADVWQQIDNRITELVSQGQPPEEAYQRLGYALAFIRAARAYQVFVHELLAADAAADPATAGFLPRVTYDQANALAHHIEPNLQRAVAALTDAAYEPDVALPIKLGPRIEAEGACPVAHLEGTIAAAREMREWAAGLIAEYAETTQRASSASARAATPATTSTADHIARLNSQLAQADAQLQFGVDLVGQVTRGQATAELHEQGEDFLWDALHTFFLLNQAVALPELLEPDRRHTRERFKAGAKHGASGAGDGRVYHDERIHPDDLWRVAAPSARSSIRGTRFGRNEMKELCEKMGGVLTADAQQYLDEVKEAVQRGDAISVAAMANCPFEPLYRARRPLTIAGAHVQVNHEFHWDFHRGQLETLSRFERVNDWQECEE